MDIRTKLVFALVAVALGSMLALGGVLYASAGSALRDRRLEQLEGVAESMKDGLEEVSSGWRDRVSLIASRTQLRESLKHYGETGDPESKALIRRILGDAVASVDVVESLVVYDLQGTAVASAGWSLETDIAEQLPLPVRTSGGIEYQGASVMGDGHLRVAYAAPLVLAGDPEGVLHVRLNATSLLDMTESRARLGATGEVMIVFRGPDQETWVLHRIRPSEDRIWEEIPTGEASDAVLLALRGEETVRSEGITDYRGQAVWAAVRYLPETGWGLIVKLDASEAVAPVLAFREQFIRLALSLGAFAILIGTVLGLRFAAPIHELAEVANRIRGGTLSARAQPRSEDEVGVLARTFNQMAEEMEHQVSLLREFQRYFDLSLDMLCIAATDGYFKRVNPAFERTLGWSTEVLLSKSFLDFVHPDYVQVTEAEIAKLAKGIPTISFENRYRCANGEYKTLVWTAHPEPETGLIYAIARDVTADKERQEKSREEIQALRQEIQSLRQRLEAAEGGRRGQP